MITITKVGTAFNLIRELCAACCLEAYCKVSDGADCLFKDTSNQAKPTSSTTKSSTKNPRRG